MIESIVAIVCGLVLASQLFPGGRVLSALLPFKTMIGIVSLLLGILHITSFIGIALIAGGLILTMNVLKKIPLIGSYLKQAAQFLSKFRVFIGAALVIAGIIELL
jgi:hypothetical protein